MDTLGSTRTDAEPYMMRPDENTFRAVDYSRLNEKRHNWKKVDTFQTPTGHVGVHNRIDGVLKEQDIYIIRNLIQKEVRAVRTDYAQSVQELKEEFAQGLKDIRVELAYARKSAREDVAGAVEALKDVSAEDSRHVMESVNHTLEAFNNGLEAFTSSRSEDMAQLRELVKEGADDLRPFIKTTAEVGPIHVKECQEAMRRSQEAVEKTVQRVVEQTAERVAEQAEKVDLAPVLEAIRRCRASVDLSPTCQDGVVQSVRDEIQKIRTKVDFTPVLQACREIKPEVDLAAVLAAIREAKPEPVDFGPVLEAIQVSDDKVYDFRRQVSDDRVSADKAIREGLQDLRTSVDFAPVFDCVDRLKNALDLRQVGTAEFIATVREEMHKIKTRVDFTPVINAIHAIRPEVENIAILNAVREIKRDVDLAPVLKAVRERRGEVSEEMLAVMRAWQPQLDLRQAFSNLPDNAIRINMMPILAAVQEVKTIIEIGVHTEEKRQKTQNLDFAPLLHAIKEGTKEQGLTNPQIATIHESIVGIYYKILAAIKENKPDQDVAELLETFRGRLSRENQELKAKMEANYIEVLAEVKRIGHKESWLPNIPSAHKRTVSP